MCAHVRQAHVPPRDSNDGRAVQLVIGDHMEQATSREKL